MQGIPEIPHGGWREVLPQWIVAGLVAISGWVKVWLDRKKPLVDEAEIHESRARGSASLGEVVVGISHQLVENAAFIEKQRIEHEKELRYLQTLEVFSRNRAHAAMDEVQRCIFRIRDYEEMMRNTIEFEPFRIKTNKEIFGPDDIPSPPEWKE